MRKNIYNPDARIIAHEIGYRNDIGKPFVNYCVYNNGLYCITVTGSNNCYNADYETVYRVLKNGLEVVAGEYIDIEFKRDKIPVYVFEKIAKINKYMYLYAC